MPSWNALLAELGGSSDQPPDIDGIRRKYLAKVYECTKRPVILYVSKFTQPDPSIAGIVSITDEDVQGFMSVIHGLDGDALDLIIHSPGGSPDAAESLGRYLRTKFKDIRTIVPHLALSAASMLACVSNRLIMAKHSFLGPIDPQFLIATPTGLRWVAAQNIVRQFEFASEQCQDPKNLAVWSPILPQYGPDLLEQCRSSSQGVEAIVSEWLARYMFSKAKSQRRKLGAMVARWLANHENHFKSHARHIDRDELRAQSMIVDNLEDDQALQDAVLSVYHASTHAFNSTPAVKIIENHLGTSFIKVGAAPVLQMPLVLPGPVPLPRHR